MVRVYFWNAGNTPITKVEILEPLTITLSVGSEILDAKTLKISRDLTFITFDARDDKRNTADVNFELLEPNDGAALQITYAGPRDAKLEFHGATIGAPQPSIKEVPDYSQQIVKGISPYTDSLSRYKNVIVYVSYGGLLIILLAATVPRARNFMYRTIFRSNKTDGEIEVSARRLFNYGVIGYALLFNILVYALPSEISGEIPSALITKN